MGTQVLYSDDLPEIRSEYIEPYLQRFLMSRLEALAFGFISPEEVKSDLKVMDSFVSMFCGIHARYAQTNETRRIRYADNDTLTDIAKKIFL